MAIRYDDDLNAEIRRIVKNFNQKRNRAIKRGFSYLPDKVYVSDIKSNYISRSDLKRYLRELEKFNKLKDYALETVETPGGAKTSRYNLMFLKDNLKNTKEFYDRQIAEAEEIFYEDQYSMARRDYLFNLQAKRKFLELELMNLNQSQLKTFSRYTHQALNYGKSNIGAYKGFLTGVEALMRQVGYGEKEIDSFYQSMSELSPAQFIRMYRESDVVAKIFTVIESPKSGKSQINTSDEEAKMLMDKFTKDAERFKQRAKARVSREEWEYRPKYNENDLPKVSTKLKKSELTPKQLQDLESLGWMDLVDENE